MDLKCKQMDCKFNKCFACEANQITVDYKAQCKSYDKNNDITEEQMQDASRDMFETAPEYHPYRHSKDVVIGCKAKCLFNKEGRCVSNGISVSSGRKAKCLTVIQK